MPVSMALYAFSWHFVCNTFLFYYSICYVKLMAGIFFSWQQIGLRQATLKPVSVYQLVITDNFLKFPIGTNIDR
jgi:hypothetical protein